MSSIWNLFPFPTIHGQEITDGSLLDAHPDCVKCPSRACVNDAVSVVGEPQTCQYGLTYARIDDERTVAGVVAKDGPHPSAKAIRRLRLEKHRHVSENQIRRAIQSGRDLGPGAVKDFDLEREAAMAAIGTDPAIQKAVAAQFRKDAESDLNQSHDFMQMVKLVKGYAEALLREKYPDDEPDIAAEHTHNEGAIYFATQLMVLKVDSLQYMQEVNRANGNETTFGVHPLILKYKRIYDWKARQKDLVISIGKCYRSARYNSGAIGTVIQALLDNMVKYAPARSNANIEFREESEHLVVQFSSLGPRIEPEEMHTIFSPRVRGVAARSESDAGQGIGLAAAKGISDALSLDLKVSQETSEALGSPDRYSTTFSFRLSVYPE